MVTTLKIPKEITTKETLVKYLEKLHSGHVLREKDAFNCKLRLIKPIRVSLCEECSKNVTKRLAVRAEMYNNIAIYDMCLDCWSKLPLVTDKLKENKEKLSGDTNESSN